MTGSHSSPHPGYPAALQAEVDALGVEVNALLGAAGGLTAEEFDVRLEQLVARARALWGRAGWSGLEQQSSELGMRTSMALLAGTLRDDHREQ